MRSLLISDIHSNSEALSAVLRHVARKRVGRVICLGDLVGYGANPNQMLERLRRSRRKKLIIRGNHDRVALETGEPGDFNDPAREAILWTRDRLSRASLSFLRNLPAGPLIVDESELLLCHGSPDDEDEYIMSERQVARILDQWPQRLILFGHTHLPCLFRLEGTRLEGGLIEGPVTVELDPSSRYVINPGSVGQPRDRDWRTSCAVLDQERNTVQFFRLDYDVSSTQRAILEAGLPSILADRLSVGF